MLEDLNRVACVAVAVEEDTDALEHFGNLSSLPRFTYFPFDWSEFKQVPGQSLCYSLIKSVFHSKRGDPEAVDAEYARMMQMKKHREDDRLKLHYPEDALLQAFRVENDDRFTHALVVFSTPELQVFPRDDFYFDWTVDPNLDLENIISGLILAF